MSFCLPKELTSKFLQALKSGKLDLDKLAGESSAVRRAEFAKVIGEGNAKSVNALFESKLLLKNQQAGMIRFIKSVGGLTEIAKRDLVSKVERMDKILDAESEKSFLEDIAGKKLGTDVSFEEAKKITELSKAVQQTRGSVAEKSPIGSPERLAHGRAIYDLNEYVSALKHQAEKFQLSDLKTNPGGSVLKGASELGGFAKSLKATADLSATLRQGLKTLFTHPTLWAKSTLRQIEVAFKTLGGQNAMREIHAEILSRPNAMNGLYRKQRLAIGNTEEAFPSSLPAKIPVVGRVFKASEHAFEAFQYVTRANTFDMLVKTAEQTGAEIDGLGKMVNSLTGRGDLGSFERGANTINNLFFSPRFLKSNIDLLTLHAFDKGISPFVRKQAALNLVKVVGGLAVVYTIANALKPGSVEKDPVSSDFGKIKIGDTRFDVSASNASLITLAMRLATQKTKSSTTGKISQLDTGKFGAPTTGSVLIDFTNNKLAPLVSTLVDLRAGHDRNYKPVNLTSVEGTVNLAKDLFEPLPISTYEELRSDPKAANNLISIIFDMLGISTNTYGTQKKGAPTSMNSIENILATLTGAKTANAATPEFLKGSIFEPGLTKEEGLARVKNVVSKVDPTGGVGAIEKVGAKAVFSAADVMKDALLRELSHAHQVPLPGKMLNLSSKLADEVEQFTQFLKQTKNPTLQEMNKGLELLRLTGGNAKAVADQVIAHEQARLVQLKDNLGRFTSKFTKK